MGAGGPRCVRETPASLLGPLYPHLLPTVHARVLRNSGRIALSVYGPIERTPGANAFVLALDEVLGESSSRIKRGEHSFVAPAQLETLLKDAGFGAVDVQTVTQTIAFPSVLDYVRFQLLATPMTALLKDRAEPDRQAVISTVASKTLALATPAMLDGGRFTFPQEAYVAIARSLRDRLPARAAELVRRPVTVLVGTTTPTALAAEADTDQAFWS